VLAAVICLAALLLAMARQARGKEPPLDQDEIRILRRLSDRIRSEQFLPFD
jgi:hypothetical protein